MNTPRRIQPAFLAVVLLSVILRFYNLEAAPRWDFDEGYNMRYSYDMLRGELLWFAIKYTFIPHPPLFILAYALVIKLLGVGVYTLRLLTASYGVLTTIVLYYVGRELFNPKVGLLASFIYAIAPEVVFWNRIGFANNQFILLSALALYYTARYSNTLAPRHLHLCCLFTGLSIVTEYTGLFNMAAIALFLRIYHRRDTARFIALSLVPMLFLFAFMLHYSTEYFIFDVKYQLSRFIEPVKIGGGTLAAILLYRSRKTITDFLRPITRSIREDLLIYVAVASLISLYVRETAFWEGLTYLFFMSFFGFLFEPFFLMEKEKERRLVVLFLISSLLSLIALNRVDHMTMVIYPFACIASAALLYFAYEKSLAEPPLILRKSKYTSRKLFFALSFYPLLVMLCFSTYLFLLGNLSTEPLERDHLVADYVNRHAGEGDLVLTYSWMFPLIKEARVGLLTQSIAYEGFPIAYYSGDFPKERFAFNTSYRRAKLLVGDGGIIDWVYNETHSNETVAYLGGWSKTNVGAFTVYHNLEYR
jgi:4-amino-4-deoxy-L-arabinose transferase-like glycosyltransferase